MVSSHSNPFEYFIWKNSEGNSFEARIDRIPNETEIILQSKKGGRRYTINKETLSPESRKYLNRIIGETRRQLIDSERITGELLYKGLALNMGEETEKAVRGKNLSLKVTGFRIATNDSNATLELEGDVFASLQLDGKSEFFVKDDSLMVRSDVNGGKYWWRSGVNVGSSAVVKKDDRWTFNFSKNVSIKWDRVGVTEGPVILE